MTLEQTREHSRSRELIFQIRHSYWRERQLEAISSLGPELAGGELGRWDTRALEFLLPLAMDTSDIPKSSRAIAALGKSRSRVASDFLCHLYVHGNSLLKAATAQALGEALEPRLVRLMLQDLEKAIQEGDAQLAIPLMMALSELKSTEVISVLTAVLGKGSSDPLWLSAVLSYGKVGRESAPIELALEQESQMISIQVLKGVLSQVRFRSQWKVEDYLKHYFQSERVHPGMALEFATFPAVDVVAGMELFSAERQRHPLRVIWLWSRLNQFKNFQTLRSWLGDQELRPATVIEALHAWSSNDSEETDQFLTWISPLKLGVDDDRIFQETVGVLVRSLRPPETEAIKRMDEGRAVSLVNAYAIETLAYLPLSSELSKRLNWLADLVKSDLSDAIRARALRGLAAAGASEKYLGRHLEACFENPALAPSACLFAERTPKSVVAKVVLNSLRRFGSGQGSRPHSWLRALASQSKIDLEAEGESLRTLIERGLEATAPLEDQLEVLGFIAQHPDSRWKPELLTLMQKSNRFVRVAALVAAKRLFSEDDLPILKELLKAAEPELRGRTIDVLLSMKGLPAMRVLLDELASNSNDFALCEQLVRRLNPDQIANAHFYSELDLIISKSPDHQLIDGLIDLRDRFSLKNESSVPNSALDAELKKTFPFYDRLDGEIKSALRSAELPFEFPKVFDGAVDKSVSVVEYCKALDLLIEKELGKKKLIPSLENRIHEFQTRLHSLGLAESQLRAEYVIKALKVEGSFTAMNIPAHKIVVLGQSILTGRILSDRVKLLDGLRAWAVMFLVFSRPELGKPLLLLPGLTDKEIVSLSKRLIALQDARNPAAHRQTMLQLVDLDAVKSEAYFAMNTLARSLLGAGS